MRGFPFVIGTDIVQISRFDPTVNLHRIQRLAARFLHPQEFSYLQARFPNYYTLLRTPNSPLPSLPRSVKNSLHTSKSLQSGQSTQSNSDTCKLQSWLAGRWAAKEAARKAWGAEIIGYKDVRVEVGKSLSNSSSAFVSILCEPFSDDQRSRDEKKSGLSKGKEGSIDPIAQPRQEGALSISHDGDYVVATVIAEPLKEELRSIFQDRTEETRNPLTDMLP